MNVVEAKRELAWMRALMDESQMLLRGTWRYQVAWGVLSIVGLATTWWAVYGERWLIAWAVWPPLLIGGWILSAGFARQDEERAPVLNLASRAFGGVWIGVGVALSVLGTLGLYTGALAPQALPGVLSVILGSGYFASGFIAGMRWLRGVGIAWWCVGAGLLVWRGPWGLLALAGAALVLEVGPALVLRRQERAAAPGA